MPRGQPRSRLVLTHPKHVAFEDSDGSDSKESACNAGDLGLIPGSRRSLGGGHSKPSQDSCLENPRDRGAWRL